MTEGPAYVILGRGRWAKRMQRILEGESRRVASIPQTRLRPSESAEGYVSRIAGAMKTSGAQIAWLCVTPGPHVSLEVQAALDAGLHVVVEKPWYGSPDDTARLGKLAQSRNRVIGIHYEYCVLEEVEDWKKRFHPGHGLQLGGRFFLSRSNQAGVPAIDNLGCHLVAIREFAVPSSQVSEIHCEYELPDERLVWLEENQRKIASIDLLNHGQPIVQRYIGKLEASLDGAAFPFDLDFAMRVANELNTLKNRK
jgi:hypothetical protein